MSSLYKLSIQGIRSFDCEQPETIQFGFPLTLICGQNGCGKTTIIECLKYATTGDLPPNSKGGAFVMDPEIVGRNNVTAQVKLAFKDVNGRSLITTRSMQLSKRRGNAKTNSNTFKTLEGQLAIIDKGTKHTLSTKNLELDTRIPLHLGASRAILDYVIFCHQDDSLWPLSEASVLKKRFDDIFEASKFTKVLENLKSIKKEMGNDIKLIEQSVNHLKIDKERSQRIHSKLDEINEQFETLSTEITDLKIQIEEKDKEAESLFATNQEYQQTLARYDQLTHSCILLKQQLERLRSSVEVMDDSYEELVEKKTNFAQIIQEKERQVEAEKSNRANIKERISDVTESMNEEIKLEAVLKSRQDSFESNSSKLEKTIESMSKEVQFIRDSSTDAFTNFEKFERQLDEKLKSLRKSHTRTISSNKEKVSAKRQILQSIRDTVSGKRQELKYAESDVTEGQRKLKDLNQKLAKVEGQGKDLDQKKIELETSIKSLDDKKHEIRASELDKNLESDKSKLSQLDFELEEINRTLSSARRLSDLRARFSLTKEKNDAKKSHLNRIIDKAKSKYSELFGESVGEIELSTIFHEKHDVMSKDHMNEKGIIEEWRSKEKTHQHEIEKIGIEVNQIRSELEMHKNSISIVIDIQDIPQYEQILGELEQDYNTTFENLNSLEITKQFKVKALEVAEISKHCHLCQRSFADNELKGFLSMINESLSKSGSQKFEQDFENAKREFDAMKGIYNDILQFRKLNDQLARLEDSNKKCNDDLKELQKKLAGKQLKIEKAEMDLEKSNSLRDEIREVERMSQDLEANQRELKELESELQDYGTSAASLDELQSNYQKKSLELKILRQSINDLTEEKYVISREFSRFENKINNMKVDIANLEKDLSNSISIKVTIKELSQMVEEKTQNIEKYKGELIKVESDEKKLQRELSDIIEEVEKSEQRSFETIGAMERSYNHFKQTLDDIKTYKEADENRLESNKIDISNLRQRMKELNITLGIADEKISALEKDIKYSSNLEYKIISNIDYRDIERELNALDEEMFSLDVDNARKKRDEYQTLSNSLREELSELNGEYARKTGEIKQMKDQIKSLQRDLDTEYKNIDNTYHEEWIKLQTNLLISNDLQTYSKALDNAIMKYHSMKMKDINKILKELWSQTYKGTDIDTIAIKSDVNIQAKGNRSYNYRVVMNKSNAELDMRGRCSAGQKVLTSILIRLALAECFGANCGMIALDEPTTNLDQENAESLAQALNHIISFRQNQRNFQLIVITHDEKFLSHINGDQFADNFYRVQRDENQRSTIFSLPISKIHN